MFIYCSYTKEQAIIIKMIKLSLIGTSGGVGVGGGGPATTSRALNKNKTTIKNLFTIIFIQM